jgi:Leucine-rich repeat (LRR) protein
MMMAGNLLQGVFLDGACYQLVYLELAGCGLRRLPERMAELIPNVRVVNLNYNRLEDIEELGGLSRLRKLSVIGSRLGSVRGLVGTVAGMGELEVLDCR